MTALPLAAAFLLEALFGNVWPPRTVEEVTPPPVRQVLSAARGDDCERQGTIGNIFGETAQARGEPGLPALPDGLARAAAAARIAQDRGAAFALLAPYLGDGTTAQEQVARIQLAYSVLRLVPNNPATEAGAIRALLSPEDAFSVYSDAHYIRAVLHWSEGRRGMSVESAERALAINPRFYNATMLRALVLMRGADANFRATGSCHELFGVLERAVVPVAQLGACPLQLAHFRLALLRELPSADGPRRKELMRIVDVALSYAARKDVMHGKMLDAYRSSAGTLCQETLSRYDFGNALE